MSEHHDSPDGRYPGFSVLKQQKHWDAATRELLLDRVYNVPPIRFFSRHEAETLQAVVDILMPQDDRPPDRRVPIVPAIDEGQHRGETPGYRYEDMPDERTGWRWGLQGIDQTSQALFARPFVQLALPERGQVLERLRKGDAPGEVWKRMPVRRFYAGMTGAVNSAYYGHPYAWDEIGYGGPAYPRGYYALNHGAREHWEVEERR